MSRTMHLGLDWGTSATKMVLRDTEAIGAADGRAYLLRTPAGSERHPSLVVLHEGKLWFGDEAEQRVNDAQRVWHDLKVQFAVQGRADEMAVDGLTVRDLSALFLTHMLNLARQSAARLPDGADARLGFKLGVPAAELTTFRGQREYLELAGAAYRLSVVEAIEVNGLSPVQPRPHVARAWAQGARWGAQTISMSFRHAPVRQGDASRETPRSCLPPMAFRFLRCRRSTSRTGVISGATSGPGKHRRPMSWDTTKNSF